jgi:hypothetical protein
MNTVTPIGDHVVVQDEPGLGGQPEEKTWKYYSRHHEMPASGVSSLAVHLAVVGVLIVGGLLATKVPSNSRPLEIIPAVAPEAGGTESGNRRSGGMSINQEAIEDVGPAAKVSSVPVPAFGALVHVKPKALIPEQADGWRAIEVPSQKAVKDLAQQAEEALRQADAPRGPTGDKVGKAGPPNGSEDGTLTIERRRRWQLNFQVTGPIDHLCQFAALGAILAVPESEAGYRVFKDLNAWPGLRSQTAAAASRPHSEHLDTLADIHRIGFADRETVAEVAAVLGMPQAPYLLAFFPKELEDKMHRLELRFHHRREEDIHSKTYFKVVPRGSGYDVVIDRSRATFP